ncbi:MAG: 30S ribosomal protein S7 [Syntrophales bacterium]
MPRRREIAKREVLPDPKYNNQLVAKFINNLLKKGKKSVAESILYGAFEIIERKVKEPPVELFEKAVNNVKPVIEVKARRVGGSTYQVPTEVATSRRVALGIRWLIMHARERGEKTMREKLAAELIDASNNRGAAIKKKESVHKMAEANKAFAHYRF